VMWHAFCVGHVYGLVVGTRKVVSALYVGLWSQHQLPCCSCCTVVRLDRCGDCMQRAGVRWAVWCCKLQAASCV
jgi:hypothetical protein